MPNGECWDTGLFSSIVVNVFAQTLGHLDKKDGGVCLLFSFGNFKGGEIALYDLGLVVELPPGLTPTPSKQTTAHLSIGRFVFFSSDEIVHFNMPFTRERGSCVMTMDKNWYTYIKDFNGWSHALRHSL